MNYYILEYPLWRGCDLKGFKCSKEDSGWVLGDKMFNRKG